MSDLDRVFKQLDRLNAPVSWSLVTERKPSGTVERPPRPRLVLAATVALVIAVGGIGLVVRAFIVSEHPRHVAVPGSNPPSPSTSPAPSEQVGASGLVVAYSEADIRFCDGAMTLVARPGPPQCSPQIRAVGVDLSTLTDRRTEQGVTWGTAYLSGTFNDGTLQVTSQGPPRPARSGPQLIAPPCPPPSGGWAAAATENPSTDAVDAYRRQHPSDITSVAVFRPDHRTWVLTIASASPTRTMNALAGDYLDQLCVVRSRYDLSEVNAAKAKALELLNSGQNPYGIYGVGLTTGADGQPVVEVDAVANTPALDDVLASQPEGLVNVVPWLEPVSS
jgi:hypothetical protein